MSESPKLHALYGGTFDPIHYGHLRPVAALAKLTGLHKVTLLPNNVPPHRPQPEASPAQRVAMVKLAIADNPLFELDLRELQRHTPSFTLDTLAEIRQERGAQQPLAFIIGQDSLLSIHTWHRWQELLSYCHLLVCQRPGYSQVMTSPAQQQWLEQHLARTSAELQHSPAGKIWLAETPQVAISATEIRERYHQGKSVDDFVPPSVQDFIRHEGLYRKPNPRAILRR